MLIVGQNLGPWLGYFPKGYGGIENVASDLAKGTKRARLPVKFIVWNIGTTAQNPEVKAVGIDEVGYIYENPCYDDPGIANADASQWVIGAHSLAAWQWWESHKVDLIHDHTGVGFPTIAAAIKNRPPILITLHGSLDPPFVSRYLDLLKNKEGFFFVSISDNQRKGKPDLPFIATVHNGVNTRDFPCQRKKRKLLFCIGRITPDKGTDKAITVAQRLETNLVIAGEPEATREGDEYWREEVKRGVTKHVDEDKDKLRSVRIILRNGGPNVIYFGSAEFDDKVALYRDASCLLMPIDWEEPFGLVMIEAMACGTPVVAFRRGAAPEIIKDGETGFLVDNLEEMIEAVRNIGRISPQACRQRVKTHFSAEVMARNYYNVYKEILVRERARKKA